MLGGKMEYINYVIAYLVLLNVVTTYRLLREDNYETIQKTIQFILLWILPLLGALLVTFFLNQSPIILNEKMSKIEIILKILFFPLFIKIGSKRKSNSLNNINNQGYEAGIYESSGEGSGGGD
jgi:uncharacterized protein YacL